MMVFQPTISFELLSSSPAYTHGTAQFSRGTRTLGVRYALIMGRCVRAGLYL
jgi:hypothetical protein